MLAVHTIDEPTPFDSRRDPDPGPDPTLHRDPGAIEDMPPPQQQVDWADIVLRIQANEEAALEELYAMFSRGIKFLIVRQLGRQDIDDRVHDTFVIVVQAIQRGDLRDPSRLMGFVRTIVRRQIATFIERNYARRRDELDIDNNPGLTDTQLTPEQAAILKQNSSIMEEVLRTCSRRDREILTRFYLLEQSQEQICTEMQLSETQFRLLKSRAKQRFSEEGRRRMAKSNLRSLFLRKSSPA